MWSVTRSTIEYSTNRATPEAMLGMVRPSMRILVVDDNVDVLESMALMLKLAGHQIETTSDGRKALAMHDSQPADVLITDLFMPGTDGFETIAQFRARWPKMKIIAMSGGGQVVRGNYLSLTTKLGADVTMRKPFEPAELLKTLEALAADVR